MPAEVFIAFNHFHTILSAVWRPYEMCFQSDELCESPKRICPFCFPLFTRTSDLSARFSSSRSCSLFRRNSSWLRAVAAVVAPGVTGGCKHVDVLESVSFSSVALATILSNSSFLESSCCSWWTCRWGKNPSRPVTIPFWFRWLKMN